jgi:hypothetical protein
MLEDISIIKGQYLNEKIHKFEAKSKKWNIGDLCRAINTYKWGYKLIINLVNYW